MWINFFLLKYTFKLKIKSKNMYVKIIIDEKPNLNCGTVFNQKSTLKRDNNNINNFCLFVLSNASLSFEK